MNELKLNSVYQPGLRAEQFYRQTAAHQTPFPGAAPGIVDETLPTFQQVSGSRALSANEAVTLQMLFGVTEPPEKDFYGQRQTPQIHKGNLLDISA